MRWLNRSIAIINAMLQQSFYISESSMMLLVAWMPWFVNVFQDILQDIFVC